MKKLRNKKTGEIVEGGFILIPRNVGILGNPAKSVAEVNDTWEDYEPEPLINDEDARGSLHSWASAQLIYKVRCKKTMRGPDVEVVTFEASGLYSAPIIEFIGLDADVTDGETYTLEELCGEEEPKEYADITTREYDHAEAINRATENLCGEEEE